MIIETYDQKQQKRFSGRVRGLFAIPCSRASLILLLALLIAAPGLRGQDQNAAQTFGMVIHGGAGTIKKENMTPEQEQAYRDKLREALQTGYEILRAHGSSLDAVEASIQVLEDSPLFNAGKGAVFTSDATNELDASIMDGKTLAAGAVTGVKHIKNPIRLARLVMEKSPHVLLTGAGAEEFAVQNGFQPVSQYYFFTEKRWQSLTKIKEKQKKEGHEKSTVGAAALDLDGNLAAGTSTGGMTNKMFGRVGDSPIIGAGTYANNETCAVSCTGHGEYFMRLLVAYDIHALMAYEKLSLQEAANKVIGEKLTALGGTGGVIAIDHNGNVAMPFNTEGMYRGSVDSDGHIVIRIYKEQD